MTPYRVGLVCLGNICRSPMAAVVLEAHLERAGLGDAVAVVSGGTGPWHHGDPMDDRAAAALAGAGYDPTRHRGRQVDAAWLAGCDRVLAMDAGNHADLAAMGEQRVEMYRDHDPEGGGDVPDPYFGDEGGFDEVLAVVERTSAALTTQLAARVAAPRQAH